MWGRGPRGNNGTCSALSWFSVTAPATHKQTGPFWCWFPGGWFVYILGPCGSLQWTLVWGWDFLPLPPQSLWVFSVSGFEALFSHTRTLGYAMCLAPQLFLPVYLHTNMGPPPLPAGTLLAHSSSHCLAMSSLCLAAHLRPSYRSGWMFLL